MILRLNLKKIFFTVCLIFAAAVMFCVFGPSEAKAAEGDTAAENVYVENICVSGMNADEINAVIQQKVNEYAASVITINVGGQSMEVTAGELGLYQTNTDITSKILSIGNTGNIWKRYNINKELSEGKQVIFSVDTAVSEDAVRAVVQERCTALNVQRVDMSLAMGSDGGVYPTAKVDGVYVNEEETVAAICSYLNTGWHGGYGEINASVSIDTAAGDEAVYALSDDLMGSGSTSFDPASNPSRSTNIEVATSRINGTVLMPGEEFSSLAHMEPFTAETGYAPAPSFELGEVVDSYGGGACQVSTTLYRAVLEAELEITERSAHSRSVGYVEPSMDAAVAEGVKDFKFVNSTDYPVYIEGYVYNGTVTFNIYGYDTREAGRTIEFVSEVVSSTEMETVYELDSTIDVGYYDETAGYSGSDARAYKVVYMDGVEISREQINSSHYSARNHTVWVGINGATAEQISQLREVLEEKSIIRVSEIVGGVVPLEDEEENEED